MYGGDETAWNDIRPIFEAVAAKIDREPCVAYMGKGPCRAFCKNGTQRHRIRPDATDCRSL
ncbi:MAG: hypothetical protein R2795_12500 [Saprospiraceae bacterium]